MCHAMRVLQPDRYKLIHFYDNNQWELFDLEKDPHVMKSVFDDPAYTREVKHLKSQLARLKKQYNLPNRKIEGKIR